MGIVRSPLRWVGALAVIVAFSVCSIQSIGAEQLPDRLPEQRPDVIFIDAAKAFGDLERPAVLFLHDLHTAALKNEKNECRLCHPMAGKYPSLKFKQQEFTGREALMNGYHDGCIGCHREKADAQLQSGPVECGGCHRKQAAVTSSRQPISFDKSLHHRHVKARGDSCEDCHHEYDSASKKLFYAKGKEGSCRYCHGEQKEDNRIPMSDASHLSCIDCHEKQALSGNRAGPVTCSGCHDGDAQKNIKTVSDVPRMKRNQPDAALIRLEDQASRSPQSRDLRMQSVPFNHVAHEKTSASCIQCHHKALSACSTCHTLRGSKDGGGVSLEQAMHHQKASESCMGCHLKRLNERDCAGCHASLSMAVFKDSDSCIKCHSAAAGPENDASQQTGDAVLASRLLSARAKVSHNFSDEEIPGTITIRELVDQYGPVEMPHRKIVRALIDQIEDDGLVTYFHDTKETVCRGCHHNSPAALKPPRCGNCHGSRSFEQKDLSKPALVGAYHIQCMECHKNMGITKPAGCTECHSKR